MNKSKTFCERYLPHGRRVYATAYNLLRDRDDANDVVQEVFARLWQMRDRIDPAQDPLPLMLTMTRNMAINKLKTKYRELATDAITSFDAAVEMPNIAENDIMQLLDLLPQKHRLVFTLRTFEGLDFVEIGRLTGYSQDNIRQMLSRARKQLKQLIDNDI